MLIGSTPFYHKNNKKIYEKIKGGKLQFPDKKKFPITYSDEWMDLVSKLLEKDPKTRLGRKKGGVEILSHPWFNDLDLDALLSKQMVPPFKPECKGKF